MTDIATDKKGRIVTFYSFKGGVGRTMALANVAFLSAWSGKRVLIMDWDLEAPGLHYYYRGLLDPVNAREIRQAPGVLDLLCEWTATVSKESGRSDDAVAKFVDSDEYFERCARAISPSIGIPNGGQLHYIGPGRSHNQATNSPYEDALANFSWSGFFELGGGVFLDSLRRWAKKHYDLVLVDSRTGMADVSGICTMQLPDTVALCFALNRQNIDGVAKVASAVRSVRKDAVQLRAVPMRVARQGTSEEDDARARAITELVRVGGFRIEAATDDFRNAIPAAENVPFYETLSVLAAVDPRADVLSLSYAKLTDSLTGIFPDLPAFPANWLETVKRRLQPRHATIEFLLNLRSAEPLRAFNELKRIIDSACEAEADGFVFDPEYVKALIDATFELRADSAIEVDEYYLLQKELLDFVRTLALTQPARWRRAQIQILERILVESELMLSTEELTAAYEELDSLLAQEDTKSSLIRRTTHLIALSRLLLGFNAIDKTRPVVEKAQALADRLGDEQLDRADSSSTQERGMLHANLMLLDGEVSERTTESRDKALSKYLEALATLSQPEMQRTSALLQLLGRLHSKLAFAFERKGELQEAAAHAIAAIAPEFRRGSTGFNSLARPIIALGQPDKALEFCRTALSDADGDGTRQGTRVTFSSIASHHIYQIKSSTRLIENIGRLIAVISTTSPASSETRDVVAQLRDLAGFVVFAYERRAGPNDVDSREQLNASIAEVNSTLLKLDVSVKALPFITSNAQESPRAPSFDDDER